jgi:hypothetical protein
LPVLIVLLLLLLFPACTPQGAIYTEDGKIECGGDGNPIILENNPDAVDPTFSEMVAFIKADPTDTRDYIEDGENAFVCSDFAEMVHNNAEAAGIRAGWVGIRFRDTEEGHAIDVFDTTDRGLVYIDCTNGKDTGDNEDDDIKSWDTVAYVEAGKKYGILSIDRVVDSGFDYYSLQYAFYAAFEKKWQDYKNALELYNGEVDRFNAEAKKKVFVYGSPEEQKMTDWKNELAARGETLKNMENELGNSWYESEFSACIVDSIEIHW